MPPYPLRVDQLNRPCDPGSFRFETTAELQPEDRIIGQPRGTRAIEFGIRVESPGFNIYVLGESGTGRTTAIERFLEGCARDEPVPPDWVYVYNFLDPHKPKAVKLAPGKGGELRDDMDRLVGQLRTAIPRAFDTEDFREAVHRVEGELGRKRDEEFSALQTRASQANAALLTSPEGMQVIPTREGQPLTPQAFAALPEEEREAWRERAHVLEHDLETTLDRVRKMEAEAQASLHSLARNVAGTVVKAAMEEVQGRYPEHVEVQAHLDAVRGDILENLELFRSEGEEAEDLRQTQVGIRLRRYQVNVIVDHQRQQGAPVMAENNPTVWRLLGRVEHEARFGGAVVTDFTLLRGGALHAANGGYLVLRARDVFAEVGAWDALKRALMAAAVCPDDPAARGGAATRSLDPEPIPLDLKVILIGPSGLYYLLHQSDEDFPTIFKVMADFDEEMVRTPENELEYAVFVGTRVREEGLRHFDKHAVARIVEYGSRLAGSKNRLSTRFGEVADLVREANYWAGVAKRQVVTVEDVRQAVKERRFRRDRLEIRRRERILEGMLLIATEGEVVGQVNGLSVVAIGEHLSGEATRVTARTYVGKGGVVQIDREVELAGPIHNKGVLTFIGYLGGQYADESPLSLSAQITFEQSYGGVEGDSASTTELYALLSSLSGIPIRQAVGVTGSVNQRGEVQAIGGVTEKVEGWYELCRARGLTGEQGVLIPASNVDDLMLDESVLEAVEAGEFHLWSVVSVDDGLEVLTGRPAAEVHAAVGARLRQLAEANTELAKGGDQ